MSIRAQDPAQLLKDLDFSETPDANDNIALGLGAHSQVTMALTRNEAVIYSARHGVPKGSSIAKIERDKLYLFGHVIYRSFLHFPATTHFCFEYVPPTKGLPESWGVCTKEVTDLIRQPKKNN